MKKEIFVPVWIRIYCIWLTDIYMFMLLLFFFVNNYNSSYINCTKITVTYVLTVDS